MRASAGTTPTSGAPSSVRHSHSRPPHSAQVGIPRDTRPRTSASSGSLAARSAAWTSGNPPPAIRPDRAVGQGGIVRRVDRHGLDARGAEGVERVGVGEREGGPGGHGHPHGPARRHDPRRHRPPRRPTGREPCGRGARPPRGRPARPPRRRGGRGRRPPRPAARPPGPGRGGGRATSAGRRCGGRPAPAAPSGASASRSSVSWPSDPTRLRTTPATRTAGSNPAKPATSAATEPDMALASTTSTTGASSRRATSAVDDGVPSDDPSNRPITPSTTSRSAPAAARAASGDDGVGAAQPGVEVAGRPAAGQGVVAGVDEVGPDLGRRRPVPGPPQRGEQPGGHGRLPDARVRAGHHEARAEPAGGGAGVLHAVRR